MRGNWFKKFARGVKGVKRAATILFREGDHKWKLICDADRSAVISNYTSASERYGSNLCIRPAGRSEYVRYLLRKATLLLIIYDVDRDSRLLTAAKLQPIGRPMKNIEIEQIPEYPSSTRGLHRSGVISREAIEPGTLSLDLRRKNSITRPMQKVAPGIKLLATKSS